MIYFHSFRNPGLIVDIVQDIRKLNDISLNAKKAGMIILGGGVCKHQIANAMLMVSYGRFVSFLCKAVLTGSPCSGMDLILRYTS